MIHTLNRGDKTVVSEFISNLIITISAVLHNFPLVGIHEVGDIYPIMRHEPWHNLFFVISRLLWKRVERMLKDNSRLGPKMAEPSGMILIIKSTGRSDFID